MMRDEGRGTRDEGLAVRRIILAPSPQSLIPPTAVFAADAGCTSRQTADGSKQILPAARCPLPTAHCLLLCLAVLWVVLPGCSGCRRKSPKAPEELKQQLAEQQERMRKKKDDLKVGFPQGPLLASRPHESKPQRCWYKPGHWTNATLPAIANNFDLVGDLETSVLNSKGRAMGLPGMPFTVAGLRPIALPKGQPKAFQSVLFVPAREQTAIISWRIHARNGGRGVWQGGYRLARMPPYQYHFVVLARVPELYGYLKDLDCVKTPTDLEFSQASTACYRISLLESVGRIALPSHGLYWTSTAYVLWDDADPDALSLEQQLALLDWLHWGGQLIISGPETLDTLRDSFLAPYLPAAASGTRVLTKADLEELSQRWALPVHEKPGLPLAPVNSWAGVKLEKHPQARDVPGTGGLLVERRVGRGRVVVSAFRLGERELKNWPSRDGFFNGCLLGRPGRRFSLNERGLEVTWADPEDTRRQLDPLLVCKLRYFTRASGQRRVDSDETHHRPPATDHCAWNDFSPVANSARESLQTAARIEIPGRMFVVWVVAGYLLVLVPANWLLFRSIGRVEWAWAAAVVIAVICTMVVIRIARLDIGFARSLTEIAVVELQGDYPRAHVTRYTALYTSLSTTYQLYSEDPGAQIQPFPTGDASTEARFGRTKLDYLYGKEVSLRGFHVRSNSTGLAHTEQMADLGGPIALVQTPGGQDQVVNQTEYTLYEAGVMRKGDRGNLEIGWLGTLERGAAALVRFKEVPALRPADRLWEQQRNQSTLTTSRIQPGELNLSRLCRLAETPADLLPGEQRLVAWLDEQLPGLDVKPSAPQARHVALVLAHLRYGFGEDPRPDINTQAEVRENMPKTIPAEWFDGAHIKGQ